MSKKKTIALHICNEGKFAKVHTVDKNLTHVVPTNMYVFTDIYHPTSGCKIKLVPDCRYAGGVIENYVCKIM